MRRRYNGHTIRRAILAVAVPGRLMPPQSRIAEQVKRSPKTVGWHVAELRRTGALVTQCEVVRKVWRLRVVEVRV